jgi:microcin C transport system substrate-binding protein
MLRLLTVICLLAGSCLALAAPTVITAESFALRGEPKYQPGFTQFDYVNTQAPRGGTMRMHAIGTFDNLHRYAQRGLAAAGSEQLYDPLFTGSSDEIEVYYPLIAEKIDYADDYTFITFHINPAATFQDGKPIRAEDVKFTFEKFAEEGVVQFKRYYSFVKSIDVLNSRQVRFNLEAANREQMMALFNLQILPEHYWKERNFSEPLKEIPVGSSGVTIRDFKFGQHVTYENLDNYWARKLPSRIGQGNFQYERYDYYRDDIVAFEAFKSGEFDFWQEPEAKNWATAYDFPAIKQGKVVKEQLDHSIPQETAGFVFNTQKPQFKDPKVRRALACMLDFEWMNKALFYGQYQRTQSYFTNTEYKATGLPSAQELLILEPLKVLVPAEVFSEPFALPSTTGDGNIRNNMRKAISLLDEAGWELKNKQMVNRLTGEPLAFELLSYRPLTEKNTAPFKANLEKIGVTLNLRKVDRSQFVNRLRGHEFDMIDARYTANAYPSSDLKIVWRSNFVDSTWNMANVMDPAIDALIDGIAASQEDPEKLLAYGRAFDRVALWNYFMIPQWHLSAFRIAYWDMFARPSTRPLYSLGMENWWIDPGKQSALGR